MLNELWLRDEENILIEYRECLEEGKNVESLKEEVEKRSASGEKDLTDLFMKLNASPMREDYPYIEPSELVEIQKLRKGNIPAENAKPDYDKIYGAWLGRCGGCLLGQPVEGWMRDRIIGLLKDTDNYPIKHYMHSDIPTEIRERYQVKDDGHVYGSNHINWINNVSWMPEDDDTNYTVMALKTVREYGKDFSPLEIAHSWMMNMQFMHACTAERIAYRNFVNLIAPPESASYKNPYREWIGAQIRADFFGYIYPGNPEKAAATAWKDACISHTKNGIYGEMMMAAMIARAAVSDDIRDIIAAGLGEVPEKSRLHESVEEVISWFDSGITWEEAIERIHRRWDERISHHWCHTVSNAMICTIALLWGNGDYGKSIGIAVSAGFDTDCNGATVGSILGMMIGEKKLPEEWKAPLCDTIISGIDGFGKVRISDLAKETYSLI